MFSSEISKYRDVKDLESLEDLAPFNWETVKDYINVRIGNAIYFDNLMPKNIIKKRWLDLDITFTVEVFDASRKLTKSHIITEEDINKFGITEEELEKTAIDNMNTDSRFRIITFAESLCMNHPLYPLLKRNEMASMQAGDVPFTIDDIDGFSPFEHGHKENGNKNENILFITAKNKSFGAKFISSYKSLFKVSERFKGDNFYIVPLSIHQVMCVRSKYATHDGKKEISEVEDDLLDLLLDYNDNMNNNEENILSYKIYYFSGDDGCKIFPISRKKGV